MRGETRERHTDIQTELTHTQIHRHMRHCPLQKGEIWKYCFYMFFSMYCLCPYDALKPGRLMVHQEVIIDADVPLKEGPGWHGIYLRRKNSLRVNKDGNRNVRSEK